MSTARRPLLVGALTAAIVALVASAAVAVGAIGGPSSGPLGARGGTGLVGHGFASGSPQAAPKLPGTVVNVSLTNMGGPMMGGQGNTMMGGGAMGLSTDHATVPHGTVSFLVTNDGSIDHEMVVLPLAGSQTAGARPVGGDGKVDEAGSLGEASKTGGAGAGDGIAPGASGWVTVTLAPGHYELVCNLPRHYAAGMYTQLNVT
ncbi:MAG TPA: sulfocyanin-like copper-binding protein [Dermatophilaceae bacterium]